MVGELLEQGAVRFPDKTALICGEHRWSYRRLEHASNNLALALQRLGVRRGDRVAIHLDSSYEAVVAIFGVLKAGAVFLMLHPTTKAEKLAFVVNDAGAACLISDVRRWSVVEEGLERIAGRPSLVLVRSERADRIVPPEVAWFDELAPDGDEPTARPSNAAIDLDLAALIYTSGSTGRPKGVMISHLNIVAAATSITRYLGNTADDVILNALPLSFDYGLYQVLMAFKVGATVVLEPSFTYPGTVLSRIRSAGITGLPIVPTMVSILARLNPNPGYFSSVRYVTSTGAVLSERHIDWLRELMPAARIFSMYGLTECKRVSYLPPEELDRRPGSVGKAMPNVETLIVDESGQPVGPNTVGELVVRGANVMQGYWRRPEETARSLRPGPFGSDRVLYTGDLFRTDEDGFLYFVGRTDDIIKSAGEKVSPREIESVLLDIDGVDEAVAVGVEDEILGQSVAAFVTLSAESRLTERELLRYCAERVETFMVPRRITICSELPRTESGKLDRRRLVGC